MQNSFDLNKEIDKIIYNKISFLYKQLEEKDNQIKFLQELIKNLWSK